MSSAPTLLQCSLSRIQNEHRAGAALGSTPPSIQTDTEHQWPRSRHPQPRVLVHWGEGVSVGFEPGFADSKGNPQLDRPVGNTAGATVRSTYLTVGNRQ